MVLFEFSERMHARKEARKRQNHWWKEKMKEKNPNVTDWRRNKTNKNQNVLSISRCYFDWLDSISFVCFDFSSTPLICRYLSLDDVCMCVRATLPTQSRGCWDLLLCVTVFLLIWMIVRCTTEARNEKKNWGKENKGRAKTTLTIVIIARNRLQFLSVLVLLLRRYGRQ